MGLFSHKKKEEFVSPMKGMLLPLEQEIGRAHV